MRTIYEAENIIDAMLVKHAVEAAGIPAFVAGAHLAGAMGELPMSGLLLVQVPDGAGIEAQQVVAELRLGRVPGDETSADADWDEAPAGLERGF